MCISEVPGLVKQTSTPWLIRVRTRLSAANIDFPPAVMSFVVLLACLAHEVRCEFVDAGHAGERHVPAQGGDQDIQRPRHAGLARGAQP